VITFPPDVMQTGL